MPRLRLKFVYSANKKVWKIQMFSRIMAIVSFTINIYGGLKNGKNQDHYRFGKRYQL